jgi:hypothetical protein
MGELLGAWATRRIVTVAVEVLDTLAENIYLRFQFWIAVQVVQSSLQLNVFWVTSRIGINFLELWRHSHAKLFADYNPDDDWWTFCSRRIISLYRRRQEQRQAA